MSAIGTPALAQTYSSHITAAPRVNTPRQLTTAANAASATQVEQVIVTARRRNESVQTTPVAVTAISPSVLANIAAPDITDLGGRVPSLNISSVPAGPSSASVTIRGIGFADIEKSFDPAVGVLIDDVYIGTNTGQLTDTFDLQSVEVLRGPQGTLFGRNTIGGVITLQRTRPTGELGGFVDATVGDYGRQDYHVVLNLPKIFDQLSTKFFYSSRQTDGYVHNVTLNSHTTDHDSISRVGVTFLWQPVSTFDLNLTMEHMNEYGGVDDASLSSNTDLICSGIPNVVPANSPPLTAPANECNRNNKNDLYTSFTNYPGVSNNNENDVTAQATWRLPGVTLNSVTGYRKNNEYVQQDFDAASIDFYETQRKQVYHQFSQELRASGNIVPGLDYVVGGYFFDSLYNLNQGTILPFFSGNSTQLTTGKSASYAGFGDLDWQFLPKWRLSVGGRYTADHKSLNQDIVGGFIANIDDSWSEFTPKVSIDYRPMPDILLYASYSEGYRSGGLNGRGQTVSTVQTPYNPETVDSYEVGAKTEWFNRRLTVNVSAYDNEYNNKQETVVEAAPPGAGTPDQTVVANAASARIYGFELEAQARPIPPLNLRATLGLLHAAYGAFTQLDPSPTDPTRTDDLSHLHLIQAPDVTGGVGFDYRFPPTDFGRFTLVGDYDYIGGHTTVITNAPGTGGYFGPNGAYVDAVNDPRGYAQPNNTLNASLSWDRDVPFGVLHITAYGRNLLDDRGEESALAVAGLFTFGYPRAPLTYGVTVGYKF